jgi:TRAP-type C4-dicarboxylate transport system substrate-binding protein
LVITKSAWNKISPADRTAILIACEKTEDRLEREIPGQDSVSVVEMSKRGLTVVHIAPAEAKAWRSAAESFAAQLREKAVPKDILDLAVRERDAVRKTGR